MIINLLTSGAIIASIVSITSVIYSVYMVAFKRKVEKQLLDILTKDDYIKKLKKEWRKSTVEVRQIKIEKEMFFIKTLFDKKLSLLKEQERHEIEKALNQGSQEGRKAYILRLLTESAEKERLILPASKND